MAPVQSELAVHARMLGRRSIYADHNLFWAVSGPGGLGLEDLGLACGTQDQKRGGAGELPISKLAGATAGIAIKLC